MKRPVEMTLISVNGVTTQKQRVKLANEARCVHCGDTDTKYQDWIDGKQAARCAQCGGEWIEHSSPDILSLSETNAVYFVDVLPQKGD